MQQTELLDLIEKAAVELKAENFRTYDVSRFSSITDAYVICTGTSYIHIDAICRLICEKLKEAKIEYAIDGAKGNKWIALDVGKVIIHILSREERAHYNLEELWTKAKVVYHQ